MKFIILPVIFFILSLQSSSGQPAPLIKIGSTSISREEFLKAYQKNNIDAGVNEKAIREYLDLFIRFKLKVKAASDARLDTLPAQRTELADFRSQLTGSYLVDDKSFDSLVTEALGRKNKDIHLAHIFIPFLSLPGKVIGDTAFAARQAQKAYSLLVSGTDFGKVAADFSADTATRLKNGDLGFITVFTLPYQFENLIYQTPAGSFSKPFRSNLGFHIFKNLGERKALGSITVGQVLLAFEPDASENNRQVLKIRADSIYNALRQGASFNEMVSRYSSDNTSLNSNGELPPFTSGTYSPEFENAAAALTLDGEIGRPFSTDYGFHILKRLPSRETQPGSEEMLVELKEKVRRDSRMEISRNALLRKIYAATGFKSAPFDRKAFLAMSDSVLKNRNFADLKGISKKTLLFTTGHQQRIMQEWIRYLQDVQNIASVSSGKSIDELYQQFKDNAVMDFYREHLERYDKGFASQMNEFKEGNLLFEMMQRTIWDKASKDSAGMLAFFKAHEKSYNWEPSADAIIFNAVDSASAFGLFREIQKRTDQWRNSLLSYLDKAQADSGRYELNQIPMDEKLKSGTQTLSRPVKNPGASDVYSFVYIIRQHPGKAAKTFAEAQGEVLNDYQQYLEDRWIDRLRQKYPVVINQSVLKTLW